MAGLAVMCAIVACPSSGPGMLTAFTWVGTVGPESERRKHQRAARAGGSPDDGLLGGRTDVSQARRLCVQAGGGGRLCVPPLFLKIGAGSRAGVFGQVW